MSQVAAMLGVHRTSVYRMLHNGQLPVDTFRVGHEVRLSRRQLEVWLQGGNAVGYGQARVPCDRL